MSPPRTKDGCIDWEDIIADGENENGPTNVTVNGLQRPDDLKGPQDWDWGQRGRRDGKRWGSFTEDPDYGSMAGMVAPGTGSKKKR